MNLTHKERLRRAFNHEPVDRLPTQIGYTSAMGVRLAEHLGVAEEELPAALDNHLVRLELRCPPRLSADGRLHFDWWGAGHDTGEEGYFIGYAPLADEPDLDRFAWPDPNDPHLLDDARAILARHGSSAFVVPNFGFALFERAWALRGLQQFLTDMALDPAYAAELLDRIAAIQLVLVRRFLELGVDGGYFGDDYGAQKSLLFSPAMWRTLIKPRLAGLMAPFRAAGLPVILHSDGQIGPILEDLAEIGVTVLNPVQPEVLDPAWLHAHYGGRLAFYGGVSTQTVLPHGTPDDVAAAVRRCVQTLAPDRTGLLLAPSHRLMSDIPLENVTALLEAMHPNPERSDKGVTP